MHFDWTVIWSVGSFASLAHISFCFFRNYRCMQFFVLLCHHLSLLICVRGANIVRLYSMLPYSHTHHCAYINFRTSTRRSAGSSCQSTLGADSWRRSSWSSSYDNLAIVELTSWLRPITMLLLVGSFGFLSSLFFSWLRAFMNALHWGWMNPCIWTTWLAADDWEVRLSHPSELCGSVVLLVVKSWS